MALGQLIKDNGELLTLLLELLQLVDLSDYPLITLDLEVLCFKIPFYDAAQLCSLGICDHIFCITASYLISDASQHLEEISFLRELLDLTSLWLLRHCIVVRQAGGG